MRQFLNWNEAIFKLPHFDRSWEITVMMDFARHKHREWSLIPRWMTLSLHHYRCLRFTLDLFASIGNWFDSVIGQQARSNRLVNGSVSQFSVQKLSFKYMAQLSLYLSPFYFICYTCCPPWHTTQWSFVQQSWNTHFIPLEIHGARFLLILFSLRGACLSMQLTNICFHSCHMSFGSEHRSTFDPGICSRSLLRTCSFESVLNTFKRTSS